MTSHVSQNPHRKSQRGHMYAESANHYIVSGMNREGKYVTDMRRKRKRDDTTYVTSQKDRKKSAPHMGSLPTPFETWASNRGTIVQPVYSCDGQDSVHNTSNTLSCNKTSSEGETVHVERSWAPLCPEVVDGGADSHDKWVKHLGYDERETDSVPIRDVRPVFAWDIKVLDSDGERGEHGQADGGISRSSRDG